MGTSLETDAFLSLSPPPLAVSLGSNPPSVIGIVYRGTSRESWLLAKGMWHIDRDMEVRS